MGMRPAARAGLELVRHWKFYLDSPRRCLRHLLDRETRGPTKGILCGWAATNFYGDEYGWLPGYSAEPPQRSACVASRWTR